MSRTRTVSGAVLLVPGALATACRGGVRRVTDGEAKASSLHDRSASQSGPATGDLWRGISIGTGQPTATSVESWSCTLTLLETAELIRSATARHLAVAWGGGEVVLLVVMVVSSLISTVNNVLAFHIPVRFATAHT
eukprot:Lankesteria_metandrocarpae@DN4967_c0_g1_i2.p1